MTPTDSADAAHARATRSDLWAARFAAYHKDHGGQRAEKKPDPQQEIKVFLYGDLADPQALKRFLAANTPDGHVPLPALEPGRVAKYELRTVDGTDILISAAWWYGGCRFPKPGADGVVATMRRAIMPALQSYYGESCQQRLVPVFIGTNQMHMCNTIVWASGTSFKQVLPSSRRTLFFYGSLTDPIALKKVLKLGNLPDLAPAALDGWHWQIRMWGQYPALVRGSHTGQSVRGCVYECHGSLLSYLEEYEGTKYVPSVQVHVTLTGGGQSIPAWCYVWNGAEDELQRAGTST